jgi:hypothetical protein
MPPEYSVIVKSNSFNFRVKLTTDTISVGGTRANCVQITIPSKEIAWIKGSTDGDCEIDGKPISGDSTIQMVHIGFWFLQNGYLDLSYPTITELLLTDSSKIQCSLPDGSTRTMSLLHRDALIYGKSFYQRKLNAEPYYEKGKNDMIEFEKSWRASKPASFDFRNIYLNEQLSIYYKDSDTWVDFMNNLVSVYGSKHICQIMYPWYLQAISEITEGRELPTRWVIRNLQTNVSPKIIGNFTGGFHTESDSPSFHEGWDLYTMKFRKARKSRKHRKT